MSKFAWVTLTTNDTYSLGALVLAHSLRRAGTVHQLAVLITPGVSESMRQRLKDVYNLVQEVNVMDSQDSANLALLARPELGITFTKLHCWRLVQFEKCVFLDSDTLILQNCDELFEREEFSAAPDVSWPDCFNSGVFVFTPSQATFDKIVEFALKNGSFDGGDQGLLNQYFADWATSDITKRLPFLYNVTAYASYCYLPAFKQFRDKIKILHFAGKMKPWLIHYNSQSKKPSVPSDYAHASDLIQMWWNIFFEQVHGRLNTEMAGLAGALSQLRLGEERTPEQESYEHMMRRQCWESGQVDYMGRDSFDNIWKKITQTLETKPTDDKTDLELLQITASEIAKQTKLTSTVKPTDTKPTNPEKSSSQKSQTQPPAKQQAQPQVQPQPQQRSLTTTKQKMSHMLTSADIEDGKVEIDQKTGVKVEYNKIEGGYTIKTTTPQGNGGWKSATQTFWDPKPVSAEDMKKQEANKRIIKSRLNKEIRIDERTTMLTRLIEGGYEEVYTTIMEDGTRSMKTKTFFDAIPEGGSFPDSAQPQAQKPGNKKSILRKSSVESTDSTDSRKLVQKSTKNSSSTVEESRRVTQNVEITENNRTVRKNSLQSEQTIKSVTNVSNDGTDGKKKKIVKKTKTQAPPPPADFVQNETTTVQTKRVPGGHEYTYSTTLETGKTITTSKTIYEEEESELTEEEIRAYKKTLKDAEKHKNITTTKKLKSESGTKKVVPSENAGEVTTVETIKIQGGTEYHYTTVTAEGIVKKATKTIYDPVPSTNPDDSEEEEIIEEYEEEIIEPGEKNIRTIETIKQLPAKFEEEVTITHEKKEKKTRKTMTMVSN